MKISIIANPCAGRGRAFRQLKSYLDPWPHRDWEVDFYPTESREHAGEIARALLSNPPDILAVSGGDGTLSDIITAAPHLPFPLSIIPSGTANVLAREFAIPLNPIDALRQALVGRKISIDTCALTGQSARRFLLMAGIGFDANVVANVSPALKSKAGMGAYAWSVLRTLLDFPFQDFQVITEDRSYSANSCIITNVRKYGGGFVFCPEANPSDGMLDLVILQGSSRSKHLMFLGSAGVRRPYDFKGITRCRARKIRIEGPEGIRVQVDGEYAGTLPVEIELIPSSLSLIVPSKQ